MYDFFPATPFLPTNDFPAVDRQEILAYETPCFFETKKSILL